ncbi:MAG: DUF2157 domain-containing protein [Cyanobacteriota bacterium]|nr:DUF2157 domain-containing protein [Cyanobacteriota bacterium]
MVSEKFRRQLRQEAQAWRDKGLIDPSVYAKLADLYQFGEIENAARNRFVAILMGLGGILMGLGAIAFATANWDSWPRAYRTIVLVTLFVGVNGTGFYLWRTPTLPKAYRSLGQGLLILGAIILGANMTLMSQMFYDSGKISQLFLIWGLGVLMMAFSLRLTSLGILAVLLINVGYWLETFGAGSGETIRWVQLTFRHMSLVAGLLFIPLAYWCRSGVIFGLGVMSAIASLVVALLRWQGWLLEVAFVLPPALLWGYSDRLWRLHLGWRLPNSSSSPERFQSISRRLTVWFFALLFYSLSFNRWAYIDRLDLSLRQWQQNLPILLDIGILSSIAILGWIQFRLSLKSWKLVARKTINTGLITVFLVLTGSITYWHLSIDRIPMTIAIVFNIMLFALAIALVRDGLILSSRRTFWGGLILLVVSITTRMLEYNTGLILKSLVFASCGVGVTVAGLLFERHEHRIRTQSLTNCAREETS